MRHEHTPSVSETGSSSRAPTDTCSSTMQPRGSVVWDKSAAACLRVCYRFFCPAVEEKVAVQHEPAVQVPCEVNTGEGGAKCTPSNARSPLFLRYPSRSAGMEASVAIKRSLSFILLSEAQKPCWVVDKWLPSGWFHSQRARKMFDY